MSNQRGRPDGPVAQFVCLFKSRCNVESDSDSLMRFIGGKVIAAVVVVTPSTTLMLLPVLLLRLYWIYVGSCSDGKSRSAH